MGELRGFRDNAEAPVCGYWILRVPPEVREQYVLAARAWGTSAERLAVRQLRLGALEAIGLPPDVVREALRRAEHRRRLSRAWRRKRPPTSSDVV